MRRELACLSVLLAAATPSAAAELYGFGRPATEAEIAAVAIDVRADGLGLPPGRGSAEAGRGIYEAKCAGCHGAAAQGKSADALVGGAGTLTGAKPLKTIGSFWPYAPTLFDYVRRAMPFDAPQSLSNDEVYAVSAYLLNHNGIVAADATLDAGSLAAIRMPNRDGFEADPRPDVK